MPSNQLVWAKEGFWISSGFEGGLPQGSLVGQCPSTVAMVANWRDKCSVICENDSARGEGHDVAATGQLWWKKNTFMCRPTPPTFEVCRRCEPKTKFSCFLTNARCKTSTKRTSSFPFLFPRQLPASAKHQLNSNHALWTFWRHTLAAPRHVSAHFQDVPWSNHINRPHRIDQTNFCCLLLAGVLAHPQKIGKSHQDTFMLLLALLLGNLLSGHDDGAGLALPQLGGLFFRRL